MRRPGLIAVVAAIGTIISVITAARLAAGSPQGSALARPPDPFPSKGSLAKAQSRTLVVDGVKREYLIQPVHGGRHPVVIVLHGGASSDRIVWTETSLPTLGARDGFIVVAPDAGMNAHWDDGRDVVGSGKPSTADDVGFLKALIAGVVAFDDGDAKKIFMVGFSNGGFMAIRFVCEAGDLLRAAGNVGSLISTRQAAACRSRKPLPWISINGDRDPNFPFPGVAAGTMKNGYVQPALDSADKTFAFFADRAGCTTATRTEALPDIDPGDGSTVEKRIRGGCVGSTTSTQYVLRGAGHGWPGLRYSPEQTLVRGGVNEDIDAGTVIWAHFSQTL